MDIYLQEPDSTLYSHFPLSESNTDKILLGIPHEEVLLF